MISGVHTIGEGADVGAEADDGDDDGAELIEVGFRFLLRSIIPQKL